MSKVEIEGITVRSAAALAMLPIGTRIRDKDGDEFEKTEVDRFRGLGPAVCLDEVGLAAMSTYLPAEVLNPEILSLDRFSEGDRVKVMTGIFEPWIKRGEEGVVGGVGVEDGVPYVSVRLEGGLLLPFASSEITQV